MQNLEEMHETGLKSFEEMRKTGLKSFEEMRKAGLKIFEELHKTASAILLFIQEQQRRCFVYRYSMIPGLLVGKQ